MDRLETRRAAIRAEMQFRGDVNRYIRDTTPCGPCGHTTDARTNREFEKRLEFDRRERKRIAKVRAGWDR